MECLILWKEYIPDDIDERSFFFESKDSSRYDPNEPVVYRPIGVRLYTPILKKTLNGLVSLNDELIGEKIKEIFETNFETDNNIYEMGLATTVWSEVMESYFEIYQKGDSEFNLWQTEGDYILTEFENQQNWYEIQLFEKDIIWNEKVYSKAYPEILKRIDEMEMLYVDYRGNQQRYFDGLF